MAVKLNFENQHGKDILILNICVPFATTFEECPKFERFFHEVQYILVLRQFYFDGLVF
jgi:hypothetical protein